MATREHAVASIVQSVSVRLTDADIKALPTTPVLIVADPGAGRMIVPLDSVVRSSIASGGGYTVDPQATLSLFRGEDEMQGIGIAALSVVDLLVEGALPPTYGALTVRADNDGAGPFTGGNAANWMTVTVWYSVMSV